jgi:hypothetical protein
MSGWVYRLGRSGTMGGALMRFAPFALTAGPTRFSILSTAPSGAFRTGPLRQRESQDAPKPTSTNAIRIDRVGWFADLTTSYRSVTAPPGSGRSPVI